jgi:hypothetical protein
LPALAWPILRRSSKGHNAWIDWPIRPSACSMMDAAAGASGLVFNPAGLARERARVVRRNRRAVAASEIRSSNAAPGSVGAPTAANALKAATAARSSRASISGAV